MNDPKATDSHIVAGEAALGLVESLLLHLLDSQRLSPDEFHEIYDTIISAHHEAASTDGGPASTPRGHAGRHHAIAALLEQVRAGHNGVRMPHP